MYIYSMNGLCVTGSNGGTGTVTVHKVVRGMDTCTLTIALSSSLLVQQSCKVGRLIFYVSGIPEVKVPFIFCILIDLQLIKSHRYKSVYI